MERGDTERVVGEALRALPSVETLLLATEDLAGLPRALRLAWVRETLLEARTEILRPASEEAEGASAPPRPPVDREVWVTCLANRVRERVERASAQRLRRVVNATGVLLHTNLGRAPLAAQAQRAIADATAGYSSLEMDLESGRRRSRLQAVRELLPLVTGAEAGFAVHNNAAAVFLVLSALARGREVLVSRGELVEIGGGFRLPDIMEASGARLVEIGTTNRTRLSDYERALAPETALILKVHPSNFRLVGFSESTSTRELATLARSRGIPLFEDLGSGALTQHGELSFDEPRVQDSLRSGADLVAISGDKLLGGPQAGILLGRKVLIERLAESSIARVVRLDKAALAALEATLLAYLDPATLRSRVPLLALLAVAEVDLEARARVLAPALLAALGPDWECEVLATQAEIGGGSLPGVSIPSRALALRHTSRSPDHIARAFRLGNPAVAGRIEENRFLLDLRTLLEGEEEDLLRAAAGVAVG